MSLSLSRNQKRVLSSKLSKKYGLNKEYSLKLHEASLLLAEDKVSSAVNVALNVAENNQNNIHAWLLLGEAALKILDYKMAQVFFNRVIEIQENSGLGYLGLAKAFYLDANLVEFVSNYELSTKFGHFEVASFVLYLNVVSKMGMVHEKNDLLRNIVINLNSYDAYKSLAGVYLDLEKFDDAAQFYFKAYNLNKTGYESRVNYMIYLFLKGLYEEVIVLGKTLLDEDKNDSVLQYLVMAYRVTKRYDEAFNLVNNHNFQSSESEINVKQIISLILQDKNRIEQAIDLMDGLFDKYDIKSKNVNKSYGAFLLREREIDKSKKYWDFRKRNEKKFSSVMKEYTPHENVLGDLIVVSEQGFGDILALTPLLLKISAINGKIKLLCNGRVFSLLSMQNSLKDAGIEICELDYGSEMSINKETDRYCYLADLVWLLNGNMDLGGYLGDFANYEKKLQNKLEKDKYVGISWKTKNNLSSNFRSVDFESLINTIPDDVILVNLQYGDVSAEREIIEKKYPNKKMIFDETINQMVDMIPYVSQVSAMDMVITIDNTTAHVCGAIGHQNTHVLIPSGSECMWYWTREGNIDPWYGNLNLHRQKEIGDWTPCLKTVSNLF